MTKLEDIANENDLLKTKTSHYSKDHNTEELTNRDNKIISLKRQIEDLESKFDQTKTLLDKYQQKDIQTQQTNSDLDNLVGQLRNEIKNITEEKERINTEMLQNKNKIHNVLNELNNENEKLKEKINTKEQELQNSDVRYQNLDQKYSELQTQYNTTLTRIGSKEGDRKYSTSAGYSYNQINIATLKSIHDANIEKLSEENIKLNDIIKGYKIQEQELQEDIARLNDLNMKHEGDIEYYSNQLNYLRNKNAGQSRHNISHHDHEISSAGYQDIIKQLENDRDGLIADLGKCMEEKDALTKLLEVKNKEENDANEANEANRIAIIEQCNSQYNQTIQEKERFKEENAKLTEEIENLKQKIEILDSEGNEQERIKKLKDRITILRKEKDQCDIDLKEIKDKYSQLEKEKSELQHKYSKAKDKNKACKEEHVTQDLYERLRGKYETLKEKKKLLKNMLESKKCSDDEEEKINIDSFTEKGNTTDKRGKSKLMNSLIDPKAVEVDVDKMNLRYPSDDTRHIDEDDNSPKKKEAKSVKKEVEPKESSETKVRKPRKVRRVKN